MEKYNVHALAGCMGALTMACRHSGEINDHDHLMNMARLELVDKVLDASLETMRASLVAIEGDPSLIDIFDSFAEAKDLDLSGEALRQHLILILTGVENNLKSRLFMYIPAEQAKYYDNRDILGVEVRDAFSASSLEEIVLAGNCYAAGLWTASVFHSMRFAEHGLRRLAKKVNVSLTDHGRPLPIEYATWDKVIRSGLRPKIKAEEQKKKGPARERRLEWYSSLADHCEYMKDIWRNTVAHSRRLYNQPEALAAIDRVRDFSQKLVAGVPK